MGNYVKLTSKHPSTWQYGISQKNVCTDIYGNKKDVIKQERNFIKRRIVILRKKEDMITILLMKILIGEYAILCLAALVEHRWMIALYWVGALILNIAVLVGMK